MFLSVFFLYGTYFDIFMSERAVDPIEEIKGI